MDKNNKQLVQAVLNEVRGSMPPGPAPKPRSRQEKAMLVHKWVGQQLEKGSMDIDQLHAAAAKKGYSKEHVNRALDDHLGTPGASD